jgi:Carboxypeptidase regulatory-like domain
MRRFLPFLLAFFAFPLAASITGTVTGPDGKPVAKARVQAFQAETPMTTYQRLTAGAARTSLAMATTGDDGAFKLDVSSGVVDMTVDADGFVPVAMLVPTDEQGVSIPLKKAKMIEGTVTAAGKPVAGALLVVSNGYLIREAGKSDANGKFRVPDLSDELGPMFAMHRDFAPSAKLELEPGVAIRGKVVDEHDQPVAKAKVVSELVLVTTDAEGRFVIAHGRLGAALQAMSEQGIGGAISRSGENVIHLKPALKISGIVRDDSKKPLAGMPVVALNRGGEMDGAITDAKGAFVLLVTPGKHWLSTYNGAFFLAASIETKAGTTQDLTVSRLVRIDGVVRDDDGKPVAGARVSFAQGQEPEQTMMASRDGYRAGVPTDAAGRFRLRVAVGSTGNLVATKAAMPSAITDMLTVAAGGLHDVVVKLVHGIEVKGVVTDGHGHALGGVSIAQVEEAALPFEREGDDWATTAADGTFSVRLNEGSAALIFAKKGFVDATEAIDVAPAMRPLAIAMSAAATVRGTLLNKDGKPVAEYPISADDDQVFTTTKADGTFALDFSAPGDHSIQIPFRSKKYVVHAPSSGVRIDLDGGLSIRGRVTDAVTGAPVEEFTAAAERDDDTVGAGEPGDEPAQFVINGLEEGPVTVVVTAEHYLAARVEAEAGQAQPLAVALSRGLTLRGRIHDPAGQAIEGVAVSIARDSKSYSYQMETPASAADGTFELDGLAPDDAITLMYRKEGYVDRSDHLRVTKENGPVDVVLTRGLTIRGRVIDAEGKAASGVTVVASTAAHGSSYRDMKTGADGAFEMQGLVPGRYDFEVGHGSAISGSARDVDIELVHDVTIRIERKPSGTIAGRVRGVNAATFMRMLEVHTTDGVMDGEINPDGSFRVENVPTGIAQVSAALGGMNGMRSTRDVAVDVTANAVANVELTLEEQRTLRGRVTHNGQPVPKTEVSLSGSGYGSAHAPTGDDGVYEIHADAGRYSVTVEGLPYRGEVDLERTSVFDIEFNGIRARARVVDGDTGTPVEGALVQAVLKGTHSQQESKTNAAGIATIEWPRSEKATLIASKSGYANASADAIEGEVVMHLVRSTGAVVRIIDARDGRTLSGYVVARDAGGRVIASAHETDGDGTSTLAVPPGDYRLSASASEYGSETIRASVPSAELRIALPRGGKLLLRSNQDMHGTARLLLPDGDMYVRCWCNGIADIEIDGRTTTVEAVSPGSYTLEVTPAGGKVRRYPVTVIQGETVPVQID